MSLVALIAPEMMDSFPRVSGDEPGRYVHGDGHRPFSPRERG